jgi:hypothetical protein
LRLVWLLFRFWRWRRYVSPKQGLNFT